MFAQLLPSMQQKGSLFNDGSNMRGRPAVIVYLWDAPGPGRAERGVTSSETRARQAAETSIIGGHAAAAVVEKAVLGLGAGSMTYGYHRIGLAWHAVVTDGRVAWTRSAPRLTAS
jgi:hypothetical protein